MGNAGPLVNAEHCGTVPLSDFLNAQGTSTQFFPPVPDYVGWSDGAARTFALIDYAGLADEYIKGQTRLSLGTKVTGSIKACAFVGGKAQIRVALSTTQALGFAQSIKALRKNKFDFLNTPTIFGAKAQDVVNGATPAVGQPPSRQALLSGPVPACQTLWMSWSTTRRNTRRSL
jgi:hypothetical protein